MPTEPEVPLGKRVFRGALFLVLLATGALLAHHRHPAMKGVFLGPSADGEASAPARALPR